MELGRVQSLTIQRFTSVGAYVNDKKAEASEGGHTDILLPKKFVHREWSVGDSIEVFILRDSDDRLIATTRKPKIQVGEFAILQVTDVTRVGAFLDWGLEKDLFLPFKEQIHKVKPNEKVFVYCYLDKSNRIAATMNVKKHFAFPRRIKENDMVDGVVYATNPEFGAYVVVDGQYNAMIPSEKMKGALNIGQEVSARVENVKNDGKIDLSLQSRAHENIDSDAKSIFEKLKNNDGFLPYNDKSDPTKIQKEFKMSKAQFKKSIGRLLKLGLIEFEKNGIKAKGRKHDRRK